MTRVFKLPSGVEAEVDEMITAHYRIISEQKNGTGVERLNKLVESRLVRIGSLNLRNLSKEEQTKLVLDLASEDKGAILTQIRQYTLDDDTRMSFKYKYKSRKSGDDFDKEKLSPVDGVLSFNNEPYKKFTGELDLITGLPIVVDMEAREYSEVQKYHIITLPKSQMKVRFGIMDGHSEMRARRFKKSELSVLTTIEVRNPVYEKTTDKEGKKLKEAVWVNLNIDQLSLRDSEYLRKCIDLVEGKTETICTFRHPEADYFESDESEYVKIDALGETAFFFPSGVI